MQLTNDVSIFVHVCGQRVDTMSTCCDNISMSLSIQQRDMKCFIFYEICYVF